MKNEKVYLDYLRDTNGDYILKNEVLDDSYSGDLVKHLGTYNGNLLISNRFFKKKLEQYTKNSKKVRIEISFEIHIKPKKHLLFNSLINSLMEFKK